MRSQHILEPEKNKECLPRGCGVRGPSRAIRKLVAVYETLVAVSGLVVSYLPSQRTTSPKWSGSRRDGGANI